jgi:nicotinamidase-related amidase/8-oxo-dGTP pyrophosphatase MutT (NUDIX family)
LKALILVDIQNDFLPGGALPVPDGDAIIPVVNKLQAVFPLVAATQDWHPPDHGSFAANHPGKKVFEQIELNGLPQTLWPVHCVQGTFGAELAPGLHRDQIAKIFHKGTDAGIDSYSGLFDNGHRKSTGLGEWLKSNGVTEVFVCGLATDYCVKFTALDAAQSGFKIYFIEDASRGVNLQSDDVRSAIGEMNCAGIVTVQSAELLEQFATTTLHTGQFLSLVREGHWEYVDRVHATGSVLILAVTADQKILLVEQYRIPVHARTIELPAGIIGDEPGRSNEFRGVAARRELLEETGYAAEHMEEITTGAACSGLTSERTTLFRASGLRRTGKGGGVANEEIIVHEVPLVEATAWLKKKAESGVLIDPKVYAGLFFATQK